MHFYKAVLLWLKKAGITSETLTDEIFRQAVCAVNARWQEIGNWLIGNREGTDAARKAIVRDIWEEFNKTHPPNPAQAELPETP